MRVKSFQLRLWDRRVREHCVLELVPIYHDCEKDDQLTWEVFWHGSTECIEFREDGTEVNGDRTLIGLLQESGCFVTTDFYSLLTEAAWDGETDFEIRMARLINETSLLHDELFGSKS